MGFRGGKIDHERTDIPDSNKDDVKLDGQGEMRRVNDDGRWGKKEIDLQVQRESFQGLPDA